MIGLTKFKSLIAKTLNKCNYFPHEYKRKRLQTVLAMLEGGDTWNGQQKARRSRLQEYIRQINTYSEGKGEMMKKTLLLSLSFLTLALVLGYGSYVQADLISVDVGDAADRPGSTEILDDGTITVIGAGHDLWDSVDGFRYAYIEVSGDFEAIVQITYFERVAGEPWAKAGLIARETPDPGSKNALSTAAAGDAYGVQLTWRTQTNGATSELNYWELGGPTKFNDGEWIRLTRSGDDFSAAWSDDGVTWDDDYATVPIDMDEIDHEGNGKIGAEYAPSILQPEIDEREIFAKREK